LFFYNIKNNLRGASFNGEAADFKNKSFLIEIWVNESGYMRENP